jgi:hypothetical protein
MTKLLNKTEICSFCPIPKELFLPPGALQNFQNFQKFPKNPKNSKKPKKNQKNQKYSKIFQKIKKNQKKSKFAKNAKILGCPAWGFRSPDAVPGRAPQKNKNYIFLNYF